MTTKHETLMTVLRQLDTPKMTTPEVVDAIRAQVPDATLPEMVAALEQSAAENRKEAEELRRYKRGVRGVFDGGNDAA